ncbi:hypothetical protein Q7P37_005631 [Cladosporium fusiforme]
MEVKDMYLVFQNSAGIGEARELDTSAAHIDVMNMGPLLFVSRSFGEPWPVAQMLEQRKWHQATGSELQEDHRLCLHSTCAQLYNISTATFFILCGPLNKVSGRGSTKSLAHKLIDNLVTTVQLTTKTYTTPKEDFLPGSGLPDAQLAPPPRKRKRKLSGDINERLAYYERILHQHGLLADSPDGTPVEAEKAKSASQVVQDREPKRVGRLLSGDGTTRYINSSLWRNLGEEEMTRIANDEDEDEYDTAPEPAACQQLLLGDPFSAAFAGTTRSLREFHPSAAVAMMLWQTHVQNVEPVCKVLHIPSVTSMVEVASANPQLATKADECILFAIYHFAIISSTDEECLQNYGQPRDVLRGMYCAALKQALVNASFLKTSQLSVLQAFILYLYSMRHSHDPQTFWQLTGTAVRIAQRIGIHRDGEALGLPPFDSEMRRRLFYQILPLDGYASQLSGTGITLDPGSWDSKQPRSLNDDQLWPGMTHYPEEPKGASEMIFFLARSDIGALYLKSDGKNYPPLYKSFSWHGGDGPSTALVDDMESMIESKYLRYCDILNPLHTLLLCMARSAINAARLRTKLPGLQNNTASNEERREVCTIATKIIDTDSAAHANPSLKRFMWHIKAFFQWDALNCMLVSMTKPGLLSKTDLDAAWRRIQEVYANHSEILEKNRMLNAAVGRLTLKAWDANPPSSTVNGEPEFVQALRVLYARSEEKRRRHAGRSTSAADSIENPTPSDPSPGSDLKALDSGVSGMDFGLDNDFMFDSTDWMFWDKLATDYRNAPDDQTWQFAQ